MKPIVFAITTGKSSGPDNVVMLHPECITAFEDRGSNIEVPHRFKIRVEGGHYDVDEDQYNSALGQWKSYIENQ